MCVSRKRPDAAATTELRLFEGGALLNFQQELPIHLTRIALRFIRAATLNFPCDIPLDAGIDAPFRIDI